MSKMLVVPYFITMQGCMYNCIYCNQYSLKDHGGWESIIKVVEKYKKFSKKCKKIELAFYGGTFLNLTEQTILNLLYEANKLKENGVIDSVRISTTPDSVNVKKLNLIKGIVDTVELGVQALDDKILKLLRRKYDVTQCIKKTMLLKDMGFKVGYQLMLGLPKQTYVSFVNTISIVCKVKPDFIRLYPLIVLNNTPIENYIKLGFIPYVDLDFILHCGAYALFECYKRNIKVIKVGLTEFFDEKQIYMGYMIRNWRTMMESLLWRNFLREIFLKKNKNNIFVQCSNTDYDSIIGIKKSNIFYFKNMGIGLNVVKSKDMEKFFIELEGEKYHLFELNICANFFVHHCH